MATDLNKKPYSAPTLTAHGKISDLTRNENGILIGVGAAAGIGWLLCKHRHTPGHVHAASCFHGNDSSS